MSRRLGGVGIRRMGRLIGKPAPSEPIADPEQLTLFLADQSAGWGSLTATEPANATDGDEGTAARGTSSGTYMWLEYTFQGKATITSARLYTGGGSLTVTEWFVQYWDSDTESWEQAFAPTAVPDHADPGWHEVTFTPRETIAVRVQVVDDDSDVQLDEFELWGVPADELAPARALLSFLYVPKRAWVTLDGSGNAEAIADSLDEETAAKDLVQATSGSRPPWLAQSSAPSRVPALRGNGTAQHLQGAAAHAAAVANLHTCYALVVRPVSAGASEAAVGIGSTSQALWHSIGFSSSAGLVRRAGLGNITAGTFSAGDTFWEESRRDGSGTDIVVTGGASASGAAGSNITAGQVLVMCANRNSGGLIEASDGEVLAFGGTDSILSAGDRATVRAALEAYAGI